MSLLEHLRANNKLQQRAIQEIIRRDLTAFTCKTFETVSPGETLLMNWHIKAMAYVLMLVLSGRIKRLLITMPPRYLKSIMASVAFPAFALGRDPSKRIICASYAEALAIDLANKCRLVLNSDWFWRCFPQCCISTEKNTETEFLTSARGGRFSTTVDGSMTGFGGNLIVIDDAMNANDMASPSVLAKVRSWYEGPLLSRLDSKASDAIVIVQQRLHPDDLAGVV